MPQLARSACRLVVSTISVGLAACAPKAPEPAPAPPAPVAPAPQTAAPPAPAPKGEATKAGAPRDQAKGGATLTVTSTAFTEGGGIPKDCTCDGKNQPPPLSWTAGPAGTSRYALVVEDPDAPGGTFVHWLAWNIQGTSLPQPATTPAMQQGHNGFGKAGYGGPCPPSGTHHYYFRVYAVDAPFMLPDSITAAELRKALTGHILAEGSLMGVYTKGK